MAILPGLCSPLQLATAVPRGFHKRFLEFRLSEANRHGHLHTAFFTNVEPSPETANMIDHDSERLDKAMLRPQMQIVSPGCENRPDLFWPLVQPIIHSETYQGSAGLRGDAQSFGICLHPWKSGPAAVLKQRNVAEQPFPRG